MITKIIQNNKFLPYHILIVLVFSVIYYYLQVKEEGDSLKSLEEALYFSVVNHFTVGFGDITPKSKRLRRLCMIQILLAFIFFMS